MLALKAGIRILTNFQMMVPYINPNGQTGIPAIG